MKRFALIPVLALTLLAFAPGARAACPNEAIREAQGAEVLALPGCMALEQVSPSKKGNQLALNASRISADGTRIVFKSFANLDPEVPNYGGITGDLFLASRGDDIWGSSGTNIPYGAGGSTFGVLPSNFSSDMSRWFQKITLSTGSFKILRETPDHSYTVLSPSLQNLTETGEPAIQGVSTSQTHVYLLPEAFNPRNGTFLPDDPQPEGVGEDSNLYVTHLDSNGEPVLELAAKDLNGKVWGGNCGARLGGMESRLGSNVNLPNGERNQGAISADGFRTYISTRPGQPATGDCTEANRKRIMVREETPGGPAIEELFTGSECTRVSPSCSTSDGDDAYQGASIDQSKVYFTTTRQLADSDLDGSGAPSCDIAAAIAGCDLYLYDADRPSGNRLVQVSAGDNTSPTPGAGANLYNSIAAIAADGSRVYFVAQGKLTIDQNPEGATATAGQPNFYTWDAETEETHFIGSLAANDGGDFFESGLWGSHGTWNNGAYPVPIEGPDPAVGGDGHILLFKSNAALTAEDTDGTLRDLYRYDATTDQLILVSKPEPGGSDGGSINAVFGSNNAQPGTDYAQIGRPISEDGQTIEVITTGGLVPADTNSAEDIYLWREGSVFRVPGSDQTLKKANQPLVSADGSTIAFHTAAQLLPSDGDTALDVYAMRAGGGYPLTSPDRPPPTCFSDVNLCPSLVEGSISSERDINPPSKVASKKPCAKGKVRRQGKCVKKPKKASKRRRHNGRSAGAKQGDNK